MKKPVALVTGGTRGIGFGIAKALSEAGFDLAICGRRAKSQVAAISSQLEASGTRCDYFQADIASAVDREELVDEIQRGFGRLDVLVNNAGIAPKERKDLLEANESSFETVIRVNLQGPYFLTQRVANWMIAQKDNVEDFRPVIINISSISAVVASPNRGEYCISKAGVSMATKLWAVRLAEYDIPVYEVRPGIIATDMTASVKGKYDQLIQQGLLLDPRWGTPYDIGEAVAVLASRKISYATGQVLVLDGGLTLQRL